MGNQTDNQAISKKIEFFKFDLKAKDQQKAFEDSYKNNNGNWSAVKSKLTKGKGFMPEVIDNKGHVILIKRLYAIKENYQSI